MKQALIHGTRICELNTPFPVHDGLKWVEVADDTTTDDTYVDGKVVKKPDPPTPTASETALAEIARLEAEVSQRRIRDAFADPTWMNAQEAKIKTQRDKL